MRDEARVRSAEVLAVCRNGENIWLWLTLYCWLTYAPAWYDDAASAAGSGRSTLLQGHEPLTGREWQVAAPRVGDQIPGT